jgi:type II secretory pathway predicted ATPase ExeA
LEQPRQKLGSLWAIVTAFRRRLSGKTGSSPGREETLQKLSDLPTPEEIMARAEALPPVCRRLFTIGALKNREFLVGKDDHLESLRELFHRWREGRLCSVAVVGPNGSGKTSLVNCFQSELGNQTPIHRLDIDHRLRGESQLIELCCNWFELPSTPQSLIELEEQLCQLPPAVIIVENIHRLLLRTTGGMESIRAFLRLVLATRRKLLWVVTCRKYPWQRMLHLLQIDRYFSHQLHTLLGNQAEMRDALLLRLQTSSYPVLFLKPDSGKTIKKNASDQSSLQERFFSDLFAASRGNMQAALYYWLLCLQYDTTLESLTVRPLGKLDYSSLRFLDRQQFYTMAEIIAHGELNADEHAAIFACEPLRSRMLLDHLVQLNLLVFDKGDIEAGRYQLNPLFFAPATATLESRNILQ